MNRWISVLGIGGGILVLGIAILLPTTSSWSEEPEEYTTVAGTVLVAEENEDGVASRVYIETEVDDFLVANEGAGKELVDHVGDWVEAIGTVYESEESGDYDYVLYVESYTVEDED